MPDDTMAEHPGNAAAPLRTIAELPGPKGIPILGNARQIEPQQFHRTLDQRVAAAAAPLPWTTAWPVSFMQQQRHFAAAK